jgi:hypothetical protein
MALRFLVLVDRFSRNTYGKGGGRVTDLCTDWKRTGPDVREARDQLGKKKRRLKQNVSCVQMDGNLEQQGSTNRGAE